MPDKKRKPLSKYLKINDINSYIFAAFVKMVLDGRKKLLLKSQTRTSLDFPKVST